MSNQKIVTLVLLGFGVIGILYYAFKKKPLAAPGQGGPQASAGGGVISAAPSSAFAGRSGSFPSITAAAAALLGRQGGTVAPVTPAGIYAAGQLAGTTAANISSGMFQPTSMDYSNTLIPTSVDLGASYLASSSPDIAGNVSALDLSSIGV